MTDISKQRLKKTNVLRAVEEACIREVYEAEQTAKAEAINDEHKAVLKEIKHTKEHERKCITKMWNAESEARVKAV
jgi:hypothetical protein